MWKETAATEPPKTTAPAPPHNRSPKTNCARYWTGWSAARDIFRLNRELREVLSRRESETRALRNRNAELEEIMRKFAPMLLNMATTMGLAAKNEKPDNPSQP